MRFFALVSLVLAFASSARAERFDVRRLAVDGDVVAVAPADLDGDGKRDLVVAYRHGVVPHTRRFFALFWNQGGTFSARPDVVIPIDESICAFDVADIDGRAGEELLTIGHDGVAARSFAHRSAGSTVTLTSEPTLFYRADKNSLPHLPLVHDLAGKRSHELVVPLLGALGIYRRSGGGYVPAARLELELTSEVAAERRGEAGAAMPSYTVSLVVPAVHVADADGDGLLDLIVADEDRVAVFRQKSGLAFDKRPSLERDFQVRSAKERENAFSLATVRVADLDGDGAADLVIQKQVAHGVTSAATTHYVYLGRRGGGWGDKPDQILRAEGLGGIGLQLLDVTGDGHPDLIMPSVSMGVWQIIRVLTTKTLKVSLQAFPFGSDRRFADKPAAERELKFHVALSGDNDLPAFNLRGDYNGDRVPDLVFGDAEDELGIFTGSPGALVTKDPVERVTLNPSAVVDPIDLDGKGKDDVILHYPRAAGHKSEVIVLVNRGNW